MKKYIKFVVRCIAQFLTCFFIVSHSYAFYAGQSFALSDGSVATLTYFFQNTYVHWGIEEYICYHNYPHYGPYDTADTWAFLEGNGGAMPYILKILTNFNAGGYYGEAWFCTVGPLNPCPDTSFTSLSDTIKSGERVSFSGTISNTSSQAITWSITLPNNKIVSGTGLNPSASWDGKDANGAPVLEGVYTATLVAKTADGNCNISQSAQVTVKSTCDLTASLSGPTPSKNLVFGAGGSYPITGSYTTSSSDPLEWSLTLPNGETKGTGTGSDTKSFIWNGSNNANGTLAPPGTYQATLIVTSSTDSSCSVEKNLPITVKKAPGSQCGLLVDFGSSAHMANGNLAHSQKLFPASGGALSAALTLYYNSRDPHSGSLGRGWSHNYDKSLTVNSDGSVLISQGNMSYEYFSNGNGTYASQPGDYNTLTKNPDNTFTLTKKDGTKYRFDVDGKLASIVDRNGNADTFTYSNGDLTTVTDPGGRMVSFAYDGAHRLTSITDPVGNTYAFAYSGGLLASVTNPDTGSWRYTYDANAFMLSKTDPLGNRTAYAYDNQHRVISATDAQGMTRTIAYPTATATTQATAFTEKDGGIWTYGYDPQTGTLTSKTDPQGGVTSYTYDAAGNRTATTLPDGSTTTYTYDANGNMTSSTDALKQTTTYTYNAFGQITSSTDPQGNTTGYAYDTAGNMTAMTDATGATTQYQYDAKGKVTKVTNAAGQATTLAYDASGNLVSVTDPAGATVSFSYDPAGNMLAQADASGATTRFEYDAKRQPVKMTDPLGNVTAYAYDLAGNKVSVTDANGNTTLYAYNAKGQVVKSTDALGNATAFTYGATGCPSCGGGVDKLTALTDANKNTTAYQYDTLGRLISETNPLGNVTTYTYDPNGNLAAKIDANGNTIRYSYDTLGRLLKKRYPDTTEETFAYDPKGNLLTAANKNIAYTYTYDSAGRVLSVSDSENIISYEYDALGNRTKMTTPEGKSITYQYDTANRLATLTNGGTFNFGHDHTGRTTSISYPNGDTVDYSYDKAGRLLGLVHKNSIGTVIASNSYTLDKVGNRLGNATQDKAITYAYDPVYHLTQALANTTGYSANTKSKGNATQQQKEWYTYDPVGNRLTSDQHKTYMYNQGNELIANSGSYSYDKNGNLVRKTTSDGTTTYGWDYENRLVKVTAPDGTVVEFAYDPFGRRIMKTVTANGTAKTTNYFYDNQAILLEADADGTIGNSYIHGPGIDQPLEVYTDKARHYYHADGLGSVVAITDSAGKVVQSYEYDSFGNLKDQMNKVKQPFAYTGREWDKEIGLYYYRARYYDPMAGRFISADPIGFRGGINIYAYVQNNPVNMTDSEGLCCDAELSKGDLGLVATVCFAEATRNSIEGAYERRAITSVIYNRSRSTNPYHRTSYCCDGGIPGIINCPKYGGQFPRNGNKHYDEIKDIPSLSESECDLLKDCIKAAKASSLVDLYPYTGFNQTQKEGRDRIAGHWFRID